MARWFVTALAGGAVAGMSMGCTGNLAERPWNQGELVGATSTTSPDGVGPGAAGSAQAVEIHRLTRLEYNNTVRDLLATTLAPANNFPADPSVGGYDNVATSLTISPQLASLYNQTATGLATDATTPKPRWGVSFSGPTAGPSASPDGLTLSNWGWQIRSPFVVNLQVPMNDTAQLTIVAGGAATSAPTPKLAVALDNKTLQTFDVTASTSLPAPLILMVPVTQGSHRLTFRAGMLRPGRSQGGV